MGSPSTTERPASFPSRRRLISGPGPVAGGSRLNMFRPHGPERSGTALLSAADVVPAKPAAETMPKAMVRNDIFETDRINALAVAFPSSHLSEARPLWRWCVGAGQARGA